MSLWGGDAVFSNLDLRLEVLEEELALPFSFVNGHIHELRIHVPWTKLTSEPIVITINTIGKGESLTKLTTELIVVTINTIGKGESLSELMSEPIVITINTMGKGALLL